MTPQRIQRKRTAGSRKPAGAIDCTRPGPWGNPYRVREYLAPEHTFVVLDTHELERSEHFADKAEAYAAAVELFKHKLLITLMVWPEYLEPLRGKDLLCWCKVGDHCHADALLEYAAHADLLAIVDRANKAEGDAA